MEVSMDGLRRQLINSYNSLTEKLNNKIDLDGEIMISADYINREMDTIRNCIVTLAFSYIDSEDGFNSFDENTHFELFNPEPED